MRRLLAFREVHNLLRSGQSERSMRVYLHRLVREGKFPPPLQLSPNRIAWPEEDIRAWLEWRPRVRYAPPEPDTLRPAAE